MHTHAVSHSTNCPKLSNPSHPFQEDSELKTVVNRTPRESGRYQSSKPRERSLGAQEARGRESFEERKCRSTMLNVCKIIIAEQRITKEYIPGSRYDPSSGTRACSNPVWIIRVMEKSTQHPNSPTVEPV